MNIYTDPVLLDIGAAVNALPKFSTEKDILCEANMACSLYESLHVNLDTGTNPCTDCRLGEGIADTF